MPDPERIYLQPACCAQPNEGRLWCENDIFECENDIFECEDGAQATEYVRADLVPQWRDIATAPKDGVFLGWMPGFSRGAGPMNSPIPENCPCCGAQRIGIQDGSVFFSCGSSIRNGRMKQTAQCFRNSEHPSSDIRTSEEQYKLTTPHSAV